MSHLFPPEVHDFFKANNKGKTSKEMTDLLNSTFDTAYTRAQIKAYRGRMHWDSGLTGRFKPGNVPHNKGKKGQSYPGTEATQFKKGNIPPNARPIGAERVNVDGYRERKIAEPNVWRLVHRLNWEQAHGPIPKGHAVIFKDKNKLNCEVDNLLLVTRGELAIMNYRGFCKENPDATLTGHQLAKYIKVVNNKKKKRKERPKT